MGVIDEAFSAIPREGFLPAEQKPNASLDMPLSIGYGQTNSQPSTVRLMLEWLDARTGNKVLDVGSGSGWTTALLAKITGDEGKVTAVEKIPELVEFGKANCERLGLANVEFHRAGNLFGWPEGAPYDRILVSAAAVELPEELISQLAKGGRLVIPIVGDILVIKKSQAGEITSDMHAGFRFVPLVK